jgi:hemolysin activation/secretion protein
VRDRTDGSAARRQSVELELFAGVPAKFTPTKGLHMKSLLFPAALLALSQGALAQQPPSAGGQLLQIPPVPSAPRAAPEIRIEQRGAAPAAGAAQARILVKALRVTGETVFSESELLAITGFKPGSELSLADLQGMAARITEHYRRNGYFVAQALVPAQDIKDNVVTIAVSEGRYGKVTLQNQANLSERAARAPLEGLSSGSLIEIAPLESRLLLLSDLPGVNVKSTLVPGSDPGTSDLLVDVTPGQRVTGSVEADNAGNWYTGAYRVGATVNLNNPLGLGDVAALRVLTSGSGLRYARASYQIPFGRAQVGVAYSVLDYSLGKEFEALHAHGTAHVATVFGRYALIRSRANNLYALLSFDAKTFRDEIDSVASVTDKRSHTVTAGIQGDHLDALGGGGVTWYSAAWTAGDLDIQTPGARAADALSARSNGRFDKLSFSAARAQRLGGPFSAQAMVNGQLASKNLDISEKMELGGMSAVRAYPEGEAFADEGAVLSVEGRMDLPKFSQRMPGQMQLVAFVDTGSVTINKEPWTAGVNHRHLSGAGVGVNWAAPGNFLMRAYYARKLGHEAATSSPDKSGRFWVQLVKYF